LKSSFHILAACSGTGAFMVKFNISRCCIFKLALVGHASYRNVVGKPA
jgi:hypothetical protein